MIKTLPPSPLALPSGPQLSLDHTARSGLLKISGGSEHLAVLGGHAVQLPLLLESRGVSNTEVGAAICTSFPLWNRTQSKTLFLSQNVSLATA